MSPSFSKRTLDDIRFRNDIVDVIGSYFHLQRTGSGFKACCPFHKEKTPSFHVNQQRQIFHCFGCGAGGNVFRFIMQHEGQDFTGAVRMLAQRAGIPVETDEVGEAGSDKSVLYRLLGEVSAFYHKFLKDEPAAEAARRYLQKRDLPPEIWEKFLVGYAPDSWDHILTWGHRNNYTDAQMEMAGLILKKAEAGEGRSGYYDRFRGRVMFTICDEQGRPIGFSGRSMEADPKGAKYINSPETPVFRKSRILYALDKARRHIVESREALVCEGQIDTIRCHHAGFEAAVAAQGTAFTEEHVRILRRYADSVCLVFDPDKAGQTAAIRTAGLFLEAGLAVRVAALPEGDDPDSLIRKKGAPAFRAVIDRAMSAVSFQIQVLSATENPRSELGAMRIARAVLQTIRQSPNAVQRAALIQEVATRLNIPASALTEDLRHAMRQAQPSAAALARDAKEESDAKPMTHPPDEVALCEHMVRILDVPELGELAKEYLPLELLSDPFCRQIVAASLESAATGANLNSLLLNIEDSSGELQRLAAQVMDAPLKASGREYSPQEAVKDLILRCWRRKFELERAGLSEQDGIPCSLEKEQRRQQLGIYLRNLKTWHEGASIITIEK
jgi:DNA primase